MKKTARFEIEGAVLEVPLVYDRLAKMDIERFPDLLRHPVYTPEGYRVMITIEDACRHADLQPGIYKDCGSCNHFHQQPDSQLGVCHCEAMRRAERTGRGQADVSP